MHGHSGHGGPYDDLCLDPSSPGGRHVAYIIGPEGQVTHLTYTAQGQLYQQDRYSLRNFSGAPTYAALQTWLNAPSAESGIERTEYQYDFRGQVTQVRQWGEVTRTQAGWSLADLTRQNFIYDAFGRLISSGDDAGSTLYAYDGLNRLLATTAPTGIRTNAYSYSDGARKTELTLLPDEAGNLTRTVQHFDTLGNLVSNQTFDAAGHTQTSSTDSYDKLGHLRELTDGTGVNVWSLYDVSGRKVADVASNGQLTEYIYDAAGREVQTIAYATLLSSATLSNLNNLSLTDARTATARRDAWDTTIAAS